MADALCGPSNALQNFKQHTQVDRSLQQDRIAGPRTPVETFRSHDPRTGSLDADFHAFENATANPFQEQFIGSSHLPQQRFQQPAALNWASDFQNLSISEQPLPVQQFRNYAPMVKSANGGWQNEFMRQQPNAQSVVGKGRQNAFESQETQLHTPQMHYQSSFAPMASFAGQTGTLYPGQSDPAQIAHPSVDADWSQAFEDAFQNAFEDAAQVEKVDLTQSQSTAREDLITDSSIEIQNPEQIRIGSDAIDYVETKDRTADQEKQDANALARVAGELLHNVQHDSSEKFQNSQFLDLMRKIRDRQVEVRNNDFETTTGDAGVKTINSVQSTDQEIRTAPDPVQNQDTFAFPDLNAVYSPRQADYVDYSFDSDQFPAQPRTQISDLHPGGKFYPEQSPPLPNTQMSGAVPTNVPMSESIFNCEGGSGPISAADFEAAYDENRDLASRYQRTAA